MINYIKILSILLLAISCNTECREEFAMKIVNNKLIVNDIYQLTFIDGSDVNVSAGVYNSVSKGDTVIFENIEGINFKTWMSPFIKKIN